MLEIRTKDFKNSLEKCMKFINKKLKLIVVCNVKVSFKGGVCSMQATNLADSISLKVNATGNEDMAFVFSDTDSVNKAIKLFGDTMTFNLSEGKVVVSSGNKSVKQTYLDANEFPPIIDLDQFVEDASEIVDGKTFDKVYKKIEHAISTDDSRPVLMGIHFSPKNIYTTNGFVLVRVENKFIESDFILPGSAAKNFNMVEDGLLMVGKYHDEPMYVYGNSDILIWGVLVNGNFPDCEQIIPKKFTETYSINRKELMDGLKFSLNMDCVLSKLNGNVLYGTTSTDKDPEYIVDINLTGEMGTIEFGFNPKLMLEAISEQFSDNELTFNVNSKNTPILITSKNIDDGTFVIMPMFI